MRAKKGRARCRKTSELLSGTLTDSTSPITNRSSARNQSVRIAIQGAARHDHVGAAADRAADRVDVEASVDLEVDVVAAAGDEVTDFAEAGGKDPSRIDEMLTRAREIVSAALA